MLGLEKLFKMQRSMVFHMDPSEKGRDHDHTIVCYGVDIDVKEGQNDQCRTWYYGIVIIKKIKYVYEILKLRRDNVVGYAKRHSVRNRGVPHITRSSLRWINAEKLKREGVIE
jgi:hypothetical protein